MSLDEQEYNSLEYSESSPKNSNEIGDYINLERKDKAVCTVCGDIATGLHYGVVSCNGCKTFFRRTVMTGRKFVCRKDGNCCFDKKDRCACRACRFRICVEAGMDEKAIQRIPSSNLSFSIARRRIQKNKNENTQEEEVNSKTLNITNTLITNPESEVLSLIRETLCLEEKLEKLRFSYFNPKDKNLKIIEAVEEPTIFSNISKYPPVEKWPPTSLPCSERRKFGEAKFWVYMDLYLGMSYVKTLPIFKSLSLEEKISLIKSIVIPNQLLTTASFSSQINSNFVQYPDGSSPFKNKANIIPLERELAKGAVVPFQKLKPDRVQTSLIRAILVLNEYCEGLSPHSRQLISELRSKICHALLIYLQNRHGQTKSVKYFADSLLFITTLFKRQQIQKNYFTYRRYVLNNASEINLFREFME